MIESNMSKFVRIADAAAIPEGQVRSFEVQGHLVAVANVRGEYYAFLAACPHRAGPLRHGRLWGYEIDCPHHHYMYDVRTGENTFPRRVFPPDLAATLKPLQTFRAQVREGAVAIELPDENG